MYSNVGKPSRMLGLPGTVEQFGLIQPFQLFDFFEKFEGFEKRKKLSPSGIRDKGGASRIYQLVSENKHFQKVTFSNGSE